MNQNNRRRGRGGRRWGRGAYGGRNFSIVSPSDGLEFGMSDQSSDSDEEYFNLLSTWSNLKPGQNSQKSQNSVQSGISNENILYTEDNIPINTIYANFLSNPESITKESVISLFEHFGPIKNVRIHTNKLNNTVDERGGARGGTGRRGRNRKNKVSRYGFITYERCEDAAMCLFKKFWFKNQIIVAAADSWHQEAYHNYMKGEANIEKPEDSSGACGSSENASKHAVSATHSNNSSVQELESDSMNIIQLNDDCLMLIFNFLDLMDLLALKKTCTRFENITCEMFKRLKVLDFDVDFYENKYLTMMDAKHILMDIGSYIEYLLISGDRFVKPEVRILQLIPRYCPNLKELDIKAFPLKPRFLKVFNVLFKSLEGLTLTACGIDDDIGSYLKLATKLQRLDLSKNSEITGKCLTNVKNLKFVNLESCQNIQGKPFSTFSAQNKTLEYLNITCCSRLTTEAIKSIANHMTELQQLVCNNNYSNVDASTMALLGKLPNLKKIQFKINGYSPMDHILQNLVEINKLEHLDLSEGVFTAVDYNLLSNLTHLKELKLNYKLDLGDEQLSKLCIKGNFVELHIAGCTKVTDKPLIEFIRKNSQLKLLDISYCQITEDLIFSAINILKEQAIGCREGGRQLKMIIGQTSICPVILNNTLVKDNRHLLVLSFKSTIGFYSGVDSVVMYNDVLDDIDVVDDDDDEDFMGYDYGDDDSVLWGLDYDPDLEDDDLENLILNGVIDGDFFYYN